MLWLQSAGYSSHMWKYDWFVLWRWFAIQCSFKSIELVEIRFNLQVSHYQTFLNTTTIHIDITQHILKYYKYWSAHTLSHLIISRQLRQCFITLQRGWSFQRAQNFTRPDHFVRSTTILKLLHFMPPYICNLIIVRLHTLTKLLGAAILSTLYSILLIKFDVLSEGKAAPSAAKELPVPMLNLLQAADKRWDTVMKSYWMINQTCIMNNFNQDTYIVQMN